MTYQTNQPSKEWAKYNSQNLANQRTKQPVDGPSTSLQNFKTNQPSNWWNKYKSPNLPNQPTDQLMDQVQISKPTKPTNWPDSGRCLETRVCDINKDNTSFITTFITSPHPRPSNLYLNRGRCYEARGTGFGVTQQARSGNDVSKLCHFVDSKDHNFVPASQFFTVSVSVPSKGVFLATDNFVFSRPLSQFLRSFACNAHSAHLLCSSHLALPFAASLCSMARLLTSFLNMCLHWKHVWREGSRLSLAVATHTRPLPAFCGAALPKSKSWDLGNFREIKRTVEL